MATPIGRPYLQKILGKVRCRSVVYRSNQTSALQSFEEKEEEVEYPPIKPKYPPGNWGSISTNIAWSWHEQAEQWKKISSITERFDKLAVKDSKYGSKLWKYRSLNQTPDPGMSDFQQDVTKTAVIHGPPDIIQSIEIDIENNYQEVKDIFINKLLEEHELLSHDKVYSQFNDKMRMQQLNNKLIKSIVMELLIALSQKHPHLNDGLLDQDIDISAYWDRYGVDCFRPKRDEDKYKGPLLERFKQKYCPFQSQSQVACQLRTKTPLPEFLTREHTVCLETSYPEYRIRPNVLGVGCDWVKPKCDPGFLPQDPFQFVNLSFIPRNKRENSKLLKEYGVEILNESLKYYGMNTAFISTVAQAYNQGFSTYVDLTYPLTTQTVMTDGRLFSIYSYQLNTLHLWKDDDGNPLRNICYIQDSLPMFDTIEKEQIKGFNDDTFKALLRCFVLAPHDRGYDMRPTLPLDSPDRLEKEEYIPHPVKEIIVEEKIEYDYS